MDILYDIFPLVLYFLGAVLLVVIIILMTKLVSTVEKVNILLDDIEEKSQSLNGLFAAIEGLGNTLASANNRVTGFFANLLKKVIKKKKNKKRKKEEEMDEYE
jgi:hypothetical protein